MRILTTLVLSVALLRGVMACSEPPETLYNNAQFEELQNNHEHARKLYKEIIKKHPDSEFALKASERLEQLDAPSE
jgi:TolA-binding protein